MGNNRLAHYDMAHKRKTNGTITNYYPRKRVPGLSANWGYVPNPFQNGILENVAAGYDITTTATGKRKSHKKQQKQLAHGWYVDYVTGLNHKFPTSWISVIKNTGRIQVRDQKPIKQDTILARVNLITLINNMQLTDIANITNVNQATYLTTMGWKVSFTNMSNVKICYEYYYVTPVGDQANTFQTNITTLTNFLTTPAGQQDVFTMWKPEDVPELMKTYRILGKSVFRLSPGETGELHGRDQVYKKFGDAAQYLGRTYESGTNTQLFCRWYGCPTGIIDNVTPTIVKEATFGDAFLATSWITEKYYNYYQADTINPASTTWSSTVRASVNAGTETVVTHADTSDDTTTAE